jgi:predicted transposase YbfD/YdcC
MSTPWLFLENITDPRVERTRRHKFIDVLLIALIGVATGHRGWDEIHLYASYHVAELSTLLELPNGIPSSDTLRRVMSKLDPLELERSLTAWAKMLCGSVAGKQIAVDGKTIRKSFDASDQGALHMLHAWVCENELLVGQYAVDVKENEITGIPELLRLLDLRKAIVTIDAMGCQKTIAAAIVEKGADYIFGLKGNHPTLHEDVLDAFDTETLNGLRSSNEDFAEQADKGHGRLETRRVYCLRNIEWAYQASEWTSLKTAVLVESERTIAGVTSRERRAYISSLNVPAVRFAALIRNHWHVENKLHWVLDVSFGEDRARISRNNGARALSTLRKIALMLTKRSTLGKKDSSLVQKMRIASYSHQALLTTLTAGIPDD